MLADPQSVTINGVATTLYKTGNGPTQNVYTSADGLKTMTVKQNVTAKRFRREARITQQKVAADPISAVNSQEGISVYIVVDEPRSGVFSDTEIDYVADALSAWQGTAAFASFLRGEF
jgi:hypothetical protein